MVALRTQLELAVQAALLPLKIKALGGGSGGTGYLQKLAPYAGDFVSADTPDDFRAALNGMTPAILYYTDQGDYSDVDVSARSSELDFDLILLVVSGSWRSDEAKTQGGLSSDADPGIYKMIEDIRFKLFGVELNVDGVGFLTPKTEQPRVFAPDLTIWEVIYKVPAEAILADEGVQNPNETEPPAAQTEYTVIGGRINVPASLGLLATGTGDSIAFATPTATLTDAGASFVSGYVGGLIEISGATTAANNGKFKITAVPSGTTIEWANANAVAEAFAGTWNVYVSGIEFDSDLT